MRSFEDGGGKRWTASVGRESWGTQLLLFSPEGESGEVRKAALEAVTPVEAVQELEALTTEELCTLLGRSEPWS